MARIKRKINPLAPEAEVVAPIKKTYETAAYVRLSREDGGKKDSNTIEGQKQIIIDFLDRNPDLNYVSLYCDNGHTGTNFERPEFERLMDDVRRGKINCIVVKDLSRFGRNYKEAGNYLERIFPFLGVRFIAINDNFDSETAICGEDGYMLPLRNLINEMYSKDLSKKLGTVFEMKQRRGEYIGAWAPYGYMKSADDPHRFEIDHETALVVKEIFKCKASGMSELYIARMLNEKGVLSPSKYRYTTCGAGPKPKAASIWQKQTIIAILHNQMYLGHMVQGKTKQSLVKGITAKMTDSSEYYIVPNTHEPIITQEQYDAAQTKVVSRKPRSSEISESILHGLVYCADCHSFMYRDSSRNKNGKVYSFYCKLHREDPRRCPPRSIKEDNLHEILLSSIQKQIDIAVDFKNMIQQIEHRSKSSSVLAEHKAQQTQLENLISRKKTLCDGLYQSYVDKLFSESEYVNLKTRYQDEIDALEMKMQALVQKMEYAREFTEDNRYIAVFSQFQGQNVLTDEMAHALIERVEIGTNNEVNIEFRYHDEYSLLSEHLDEEVMGL
ncbi:MAG: recombinase family protein [Eubacteriales bacterium]|nr:recombinase family protein [Eubacteriales bacterium]